jgi:hypothetical protein
MAEEEVENIPRTYSSLTAQLLTALCTMKTGPIDWPALVRSLALTPQQVDLAVSLRDSYAARFLAHHAEATEIEVQILSSLAPFARGTVAELVAGTARWEGRQRVHDLLQMLLASLAASIATGSELEYVTSRNLLNPLQLATVMKRIAPEPLDSMTLLDHICGGGAAAAMAAGGGALSPAGGTAAPALGEGI